MKRALVLSLICVLGLGFSSFAFASLTGSWDTDITIDPVAVTIDIDSTIKVNYIVGAWTFSSVTIIEDAIWTEQNFTASGALGLFTTIGSTLKFDPINVEWLSWNANAKMLLGGVTFSYDFTLAPHQTYGTVATTKLGVVGSIGDVGINALLTLGSGMGCDFDFNAFQVTATFPFCCELTIAGTLKFNCEDGFDSACFSTTFPIMSFGTGSAEICFDLDGKHVTFGFDPITSALAGCVEVYGWTGSAFTGIGITCTFGNVDFRAETWTGEGDAPVGLGLLRGTEYFEAYQIKTLDPGCCGPFDFSLVIFFEEGIDTLFEVSVIDVDFGIVLSEQFKLKMGLLVDVEAGEFTEWTIGFLVTWPGT